jgi:hypothetical protein
MSLRSSHLRRRQKCDWRRLYASPYLPQAPAAGFSLEFAV